MALHRAQHQSVARLRTRLPSPGREGVSRPGRCPGAGDHGQALERWGAALQPGLGRNIWFEGTFGVTHAQVTAGLRDEARVSTEGASPAQGVDGCSPYTPRNDPTEETTAAGSVASTAWYILAASTPQAIWSGVPRPRGGRALTSVARYPPRVDGPVKRGRGQGESPGAQYPLTAPPHAVCSGRIRTILAVQPATPAVFSAILRLLEGKAP